LVDAHIFGFFTMKETMDANMATLMDMITNKAPFPIAMIKSG